MAKSNNPSQPPAAESYSPESWEQARHYVGVLGAVPSAFTSCVHFLRKDIDENGCELTQRSKFALGRLLRSDIFRASLFYGLATFFEEDLQGYEYVTGDTIGNMYGADGALVTTCLLFLHRRLHKTCDPAEWQYIARHAVLDSEIGGYLGRAIPNIGFPLGLMIGGIRHLATAPFLALDKKGFQNYRRKCGKTPFDMRFDMRSEFEIWSCNHAQTAALLLQCLGSGVQQTDNLLAGLDPEARTDGLSQEALKVKLAAIWIEALRTTGEPPDMTHNSKYYPLKAELDWLLDRVADLRNNGTRYNWLERGKEDISPDKTPQLFSAADIKRAMTNVAEKAAAAGVTLAPEEQAAEELDQELMESLEDTPPAG